MDFKAKFYAIVAQDNSTIQVQYQVFDDTTKTQTSITVPAPIAEATKLLADVGAEYVLTITKKP